MTWVYILLGVVFVVIGLIAVVAGPGESGSWQDRIMLRVIGLVFFCVGVWVLLPTLARMSDGLLATKYATRVHSHRDLATAKTENDRPSGRQLALEFTVLTLVTPLIAGVLRKEHPRAARWILLFVPFGLFILAPHWVPTVDAVLGTSWAHQRLVTWIAASVWPKTGLLGIVGFCEFIWILSVAGNHFTGVHTSPLTTLIVPFPLLIAYEAADSSHRWWSRVLFFIGGLIGGGILNAVIQWESGRAQAARDAGAQLLLDRLGDGTSSSLNFLTFCLYLRPFMTTSKLDAQLRGQGFGPLDVETILEHSLRPRFELVALGRRSEAPVLGAHRTYVPDEQWWDYFRRLATHAAQIFVLPNDQGSTPDEISWLISSNFLCKCIFLMPETPTGQGFHAEAGIQTTVQITEEIDVDYSSAWEATRKAFAERLRLELPTYDQRGALFRLNGDGAVSSQAALSLGKSLLKVIRVRKILRTLGFPPPFGSLCK